MRFNYSSGQRPLDGFVLKRGVGRGGFGEVYFAVSDGGKEVALKLLRGNLDIELRGVAQCLNLKHPNLVNLYDIKTDAQGDRWVVMEYVAGEPLNVVINRHPQGLPTELVVQWFGAMAKAVTCLHDHGIVHRDLKPANIFLENGTVKVGDYGLSKFISGSQHGAQTQSVGTVHYMAPEISTGNYNKQIDIYAAGVLLYEMLTGKVPFDGESAGEILMKHLTAPPDLTKLPAAYVPVVSKALAKNPAHRYASLAEMARAVEAAAQVVEACPAAPAKQAHAAKPAPAPVAAAVAKVVPVPPAPAPALLDVLPATTFRGNVAELTGSLALVPLLAGLATLVVAAMGRVSEPTELGAGFFLTVAICWAVMLPAKLWSGAKGDPWTRRVVMMLLGIGVGAGALWLDGWLPRLPDAGSGYGRSPLLPTGMVSGNGLRSVAGYLTYFGLAFFALRWWRLAERTRSHRFSFAPVLAAGFWGYILLALWSAHWRGALALVVSSVIVQLVSPWEAPPPPAPKRMKMRYA